MTAPRLQPTVKTMTRRSRMDYTHTSHAHEPYHSQLPAKNKLCVDTISTGVVKLATVSKALRQGEAGGPDSIFPKT